jgi:hypothetical protein
MAQCAFAADFVNEDAAHGLSGGGEEMGAPVDFGIGIAGLAQPGFMDQRRRLQRITRGFVRHPGGRQLAQLLIDQRQQFIGGPGVALVDGVEDAGDVAHLVSSLCFEGPSMSALASPISA